MQDAGNGPSPATTANETATDPSASGPKTLGGRPRLTGASKRGQIYFSISVRIWPIVAGPDPLAWVNSVENSQFTQMA